MGTLATPQALTARWEEVLTDPTLRDLPYKIELNARGKVEMTPASNRGSRLCGAIAAALGRQLQGSVFIGCSILTRSGIRSPDVAWASPDFMQAFGEMTPYVQAPEICVEIVSGATTPAQISERLSSYFAAGANEVWLVSEDGGIRYVGAAGDQAASRFPVLLSLPASAGTRP
jgi:Uma2 family endonuclease